MKFLHALTLFATVGIALAKEFFINIGIQADYPTIGAFGLAVTTMLIFRGLVSVLGVALICLLASLSLETLHGYHLDREMLLAAALTIILFPWIHKLVRDS